MASFSMSGSRRPHAPPPTTRTGLYNRVLLEAIKRIDEFCDQDSGARSDPETQ